MTFRRIFSALPVVIVLWLMQSRPAVGQRLRDVAPWTPARDTTSLDVNRIVLRLNGRGSLNYEVRSGADWNYHPARDPWTIVFDHGLWVIGKSGDTVGAAIAQWGSSYAPGPIVGGRPALDIRPWDSLRYRPYKISRGDDATSNPDYAQWPADLGAPVDERGEPRILGDRMDHHQQGIRSAGFSICLALGGYRF